MTRNGQGVPAGAAAIVTALADAGRITHQRLDQAALGAAVAKAVVTIGRDRPGGPGDPRLIFGLYAPGH